MEGRPDNLSPSEGRSSLPGAIEARAAGLRETQEGETGQAYGDGGLVQPS